MHSVTEALLYGLISRVTPEDKLEATVSSISYYLDENYSLLYQTIQQYSYVVQNILHAMFY